MMKKYAALIALTTIAPLFGAAHAPGELTAVTGAFGPDFVPFAPEAKVALFAHLRATFHPSEQSIVDRLEAREDDYLRLQSGDLMRRIIGGGDAAGVKLLVQVAGDCVGSLSDKGSKGSSYMSYAAGLKDRKLIVEALHKLGAPVDAAPGEKISPLESAVSNAHKDMVEWLIGKGAKVDDPKRPSILMSVEPISSNDGLCDLLLKHGATIERLKEREKGEVLNKMCSRTETSPYQLGLVLQAGLDPNCKYGEGEVAPLHVAAGKGNLPAIEQLLAHGADPEIKAAGNNTALHYAVSLRKFDAIYALLPFYNEIHQVDNMGVTPMHHAADLKQSKELERFLWIDMQRPE